MIGTRLGNRYEIVRELGRGGMGVVYLGRDAMLERDVAIKLIPPGVLDSDSHERFRREAKVVAKLDHPGIVAVHDFAAHDDALFYVMPFVRGQNLREVVDHEKLTLGDILDVFRQIAEALAYSHAAGVTHRDIKPENVMVSRDEAGKLRVRVTDFGLAVAHREARLTASGMVVGTLAYLSPEQLSRQEIDHRTDLYAFGALMYEVVTGATPFETTDTASLVYLIAHAAPARPSDLGVSLPAELEMLILQCLEKDRARRPQSAADIADLVARCSMRLRGSDEFEKVHKTASIRVAGRATTPMIGRQREFGVLQERFAESAAHCRFVLVGGPAGIGKTRLVEELEHLASARRVPVLRASVMGTEHALPFGSLCRIIEEYFRTRSGTDFSDLAPELVQRFPMLMEIPELRDSARSAPLDRTADRMSVFDVIARAFIRIATAQPVVIVIEDLHNGDVTIEALQHAIARMAAVPVLVVATYRSDDVDRAHAVTKMLADFRKERHFTHLELAPLALDDHRKLVSSILGSARIDEEVMARTFAATEGNPQFATELVRSLLESREIVQAESGAWKLASDAAISAESLPSTIQQAIERRLERLPEQPRAVLSAASIAGRTFELDELIVLSEESEEKVEAALDDLLALRFVEEDRHRRSDRLAFVSGIVRDVLYAAIPRRKRRALHRRLAEHIEQRNASRLERVYPTLLEHYQHGDVPEKVLQFGLAFARASLDTFSPGDAMRAARVVLEFVDEDEAPRAEARRLLAEALHMDGRTDEALPEIDAAVRLFDRLGDENNACAAATTAAEMAWQGQKINETRRWVEKAIAYARRTGNDDRLLKLLSLGAAAANLRGDRDAAAHYLEEAEKLRPHRSGGYAAIPRAGTLHIGMPIPMNTLDPVENVLTWQGEVLALVFDTLVRFDDEARLRPHLAEWFRIEEGGRRYRFRLREGLEFHDGRPVTSADVQYTFERLRHGKDTWRLHGIGHLQAVHIVSPIELVIELDRPMPTFLCATSDESYGIVPAGMTEFGTDWRSCPGTGPFRVARFEPGRRLDLEANPRYWRRGVPGVERLVISFGVPPAEIAAGFRGGRFTFAFALDPSDHRAMRLRPEGARYAATPGLSTSFLALNSKRGPLRDRGLRERLLASIDLGALVAENLGALVIPASGMLPPGLLGHAPSKRERITPRENDTQLRVSLQAGVFSSFRTAFRGFADAISRVLGANGFTLSITAPTPAALSANPGFDVYFGVWTSDYPDPDGFAHGLLHTTEGVLGPVCGTPEIDALLDRGREEIVPEIRYEIYREIESILVQESLMLPLFHDQTYGFARPEVERFRVRRFFPSVPFEEFSLRATTTS